MPPTPRQRLRAALARREPDRPPFDLGSTQVTSIAARAQRRLRARLGMAGGRSESATGSNSWTTWRRTSWSASR